MIMFADISSYFMELNYKTDFIDLNGMESQRTGSKYDTL